MFDDGCALGVLARVLMNAGKAASLHVLPDEAVANYPAMGYGFHLTLVQ
jgi:hypothetical protein